MGPHDRAAGTSLPHFLLAPENSWFLNGEGNRAKAMSLLDESLAISGELGMRPLMERVLSRREILKA